MTLPQSPDGDKCRTCNQPHPWPDGTVPKHPFNGGDAVAFSSFDAKKRQFDEQYTARPQPWPFDPVLRQALIDKGILTPDDLLQAEAKIRAVTAQWEANNDASGAAGRS